MHTSGNATQGSGQSDKQHTAPKAPSQKPGQPSGGQRNNPPVAVAHPGLANPVVSSNIFHYFDQKTDGFYLKTGFVLFYLSGNNRVYITTLKALLRQFPQFGGSNNNSSLDKMLAKEIEAGLNALGKEPDTAWVQSECWKGDPQNYLFRGKTILSRGLVCSSGCGLIVTPVR